MEVPLRGGSFTESFLYVEFPSSSSSSSYMVESVNLPCLKGTLRAFIPGVSKLVRILGCTAYFLYFRGTQWGTFKVPQISSTPEDSH